MTKITRTDKVSPAAKLAELAVFGPDDTITMEERTGGEEIRAAAATEEWALLPAEMRGRSWGAAVRDTDLLDLKAFEELGFEFHPDDRLALVKSVGAWGFEGKKAWLRKHLADPLFVRAKLPIGWRMRDLHHTYGYWNSIDDEKGFCRVSIFYKAAFYDRHAHMYIQENPTTEAQDKAYSDWMLELNGEEYRSPSWRREGQKLYASGNVLIKIVLTDYPKRTEKSKYMVLPTFVLGTGAAIIRPNGTFDLKKTRLLPENAKKMQEWIKEYSDEV